MRGCSLWAVRNVKDQVSKDQTLYQYRTRSNQKLKFSAATYNTDIVLISNEKEDEVTEKDCRRFGGETCGD